MQLLRSVYKVVIFVFVASLLATTFVGAQTLTDLGANPPTPGVLDIVQTNLAGNQTLPDGLNYYTDNQTDHNAGETGQTFTTGNNSGGYVLSSLALRTAGLNSYSGVGNAISYILRIYSVSGGNATPITNFTSGPFSFSDGDWLQWIGLSIPLAANTSYAYAFGKANSDGNWEALAVANGNVYAGGEIGFMPVAGGAITFGSSHAFDAVFIAGMTPPGTPMAGQLAVSPATNVLLGTPITISSAVSGASPLSLRWYFNNGSGYNIISGATNNPLAFTGATTNTGQYELVVSNGIGTATSAPVAISISLDITPPVVVRALNFGATNVEVDFSKSVEAASATNLANYQFTNGTSITGALLNTNNTSVILTCGNLSFGSNYTLVINSVRDRAVPPNTLATNTTISFVASAYTPSDIGGSTTLSSVSGIGTNGVMVTAVGNDIGGTSDQFNFDYQPLSGNFDVDVRVAGLSPADVWAKAGLMAREALSANGRFAAAVATPSMIGCFFETRDPAGGTAVSTGNFPANYPNTWLRLKRAGNVFTGFASYDGQTWTQLGTQTISMSNQVYLGFASSSRSTNQQVTAQFVGEANVLTNTNVATITNPHEPLGPSSRKSPIVISEIMYKPAPRSDTNNCEFIEIYNSQPFFHDISGYQITCADMSYTFPPKTIMPAGAFFVIAASPQSLGNVYGLTNNVYGPYSGSLKKTETLELLDEQGAVLLTVPYLNTSPWPVAASGSGHSIVLANPTYGEGDPRAWDISDAVGGSPGQVDAFHPSLLRSVVINEVLAHSENVAIPRFVELYNHSAQAVDLSGCILTDDTSTNQFVIPVGTLVGANAFISFNQSSGFNLNAAGDTIYLIKPDGSRVIDAVQFEAQADGISQGRWPDGATDFYPLQTLTPGTNNSAIVIGNVVINELMYDPISENDDDQYIELYNQGSNAVSLAKWQFTAGITFTFPTNATIAAGGYVVVGKNTVELFSIYTNLNSANTYGNFSGKLSHNGERVALAAPQTLNGTNTIYVVEDEVTYGTGGRWGQWASGGGSSLELIDPHSNHRLAANWNDSDETQKSQWVNIENTGVMDGGANYENGILHVQIGLLDAGECLVDNVECDFNGINYVLNSTFETGLTNWSLQGDHSRSSLESSGYQSSFSLHLRSSDKIWTGDNSAQATLASNPLTAGNVATLRFKARWLHGWPEALLRMNGNWLEATGKMPVPANLGTPGARNSAAVTNAGPAMYAVTHSPTLPAASQAAIVTAQVNDPDGVQAMTLFYRLDPATNYTAVAMTDAGTSGDVLAGDGIFSATIPGQAANKIVAYYVTAIDKLGATTRFPALRPGNNEPVRECVIMFGDSIPGGSFGTYHIWITQTNISRWTALSDMSNEGNDLTFVNDTRVIYNVSGRFAGSPYHQNFNTPVGSQCHYKWTFPDDDQFLGTTDFNKIHDPGNGAGDDGTLQREQTCYTLMRALGVPWLSRRYVAVYANGNRRGVLMEDTQTPGGDMVKEHFPNDTDGYLYKMQPWFEFAPAPSGSTIGFNENEWVTLNSYTTTGGAKKAAHYRYNYELRRTPGSYNDFTNVYSLIDAAHSYGSANYVANLENMADMENWMRVFAANHAAANRDVFGATTEQNLYGYIGTQGTKYSLLMFDFNICLDHGEWSPGQNLFLVNSDDPYLSDVYATPTFRRMYWRALQELVNGPLIVTNTAPLCNAKYNAFVNAGLNVENPNSSMLPWIAAAGVSIASQLAAVNSTNFSVKTTVQVTNNTAYISGTAPVGIDTVWINGEATPITWTTLTNWTVAIPLKPGTNLFTATGVDRHNQPVAGATTNLFVVYGGVAPSPIGQVVINEIMYDPSVPGAQFVELYNNSTTNTFDLSNWTLPALGYAFPAGSLLAPQAYLVLGGNAQAFTTAYGGTTPLFDTFSGSLSTNGLSTLTLVQPVAQGSSNIVVAEVQYNTVTPWPSFTNGGTSLQLIDPLQDNWREGNWAVSTSAPTATPGAVNNVAATLTPFPQIWINEVQPQNQTGITNSAGQHAPWIELYNPTTHPIALNNLYLGNNYANLTNWVFPAGAFINAGQYKIIFADGQTNLSTITELHTGFTLSNSSGSIALSRLYNGQPQILDYLDYTNLPANYSYGSFPDGESFVREQFFAATPRSANIALAPPLSFIAYTTPGAVYSQNFDSLPNPGATSINTANPVTIAGVIYSLANPFDFAYPTVASGSLGGLGNNYLAGWYGMADPTASVGTRFGATDGDQTTGGVLSFGPPNSGNRALGLLATSTTGFTGFGAKFINQSGAPLNCLNVQLTGEVWRQSNVPKTLQFYYFIDPVATNTLTTNATAHVNGLNVSFPTVATDSNGVAVDGTLPANQSNITASNLVITNWPSGAALWLVWEMADSSGKAQGLGIDNFSFSATSVQSIVSQSFALGTSGTNAIISWQAPIGPKYQLEYKASLDATTWTLLGSPIPGTGGSLSFTNPTSQPQGFYRLLINQ